MLIVRTENVEQLVCRNFPFRFLGNRKLFDFRYSFPILFYFLTFLQKVSDNWVRMGEIFFRISGKFIVGFGERIYSREEEDINMQF